ncbi:MAG: SDR family oxidoreductase [Alphaproteobacteria bacterium]|nr:SDR family oxidoreductase [Alphaproteobacteria bacterium]
MMLDGRKIIVTGGASGIGRATCVLAAREGADVAIGDIDRDMAEETAALVRAEGREALVVELDTSKAADARRLADETAAAFGTIDGIVCCAMKLKPAKLEELSEADWDMVIDIGLKGYFLCAQAAGRVMLEKGSGSIVFVSSIGGVQAYNGAGAYSIAKAGNVMLGNLFGVEWGGRGVRANTVLPGQVHTPMTDPMFSDPEVAAGRAAVVPMGRVGLPEEIAEACVFLLSDRASYVNAAMLKVDGGQAESKMIHTPGRSWGGSKMDYDAG